MNRAPSKNYGIEFIRKTRLKAHFVATKPLSSVQENAVFLSNILTPNSGYPIITLSPDYNENDPTSPLLAMIVPNMSAYTLLNQCLHGKSNAMDLAFQFGIITPYDMRCHDEFPGTYGRKRSARPVELIHPDIESIKNVHGWTKIKEFSITNHDLHHLWTSSQNQHKPLLRYLRTLFEKEKKFVMSKNIWKLTDINFAEPASLLFVQNNKVSLKDKSLCYAWNIAHYLEKICNFSYFSDKNTNGLLVIADMIIHSEKWNELMGENPEKILCKELTGVFVINVIPLIVDSAQFDFFQIAFNKMKRVIEEDPGKSIKYYVLKYTLFNYPDTSPICQDICSMIKDWDDILYWNRNNGLMLKPIDTSDKALSITTTNRTSLLTNFNNRIHRKTTFFKPCEEEIDKSKQNLHPDSGSCINKYSPIYQSLSIDI